MPKFVPSGYISIGEALNRVGREIFASEWTGEEHRARRDLISEEEWLKTKNISPARGSGAPGSGGGPVREPAATATIAPAPADPSDPTYQREYRASQRCAAARDRLRLLLECGDVEAAILDPWSGELYRASTALWRRAKADRIVQTGQAPLPGRRNIGWLYIKQFAEPGAPLKPLPEAKIGEAIGSASAARRLGEFE